LKRGWTIFSQRASTVLAVALATVAASAASAQNSGSSQRANELTLAGLRPGRDSLTSALKRYKAKYSSNDENGATEKQWSDPCTGHSLTLNLGAQGVIQEITVSSLEPLDGKCESRRNEVLDEKDWVTSRGLHLGDTQDRVSELYGEPNSSGPSVRGNTELEFLYYPFDWAGSDVPQAMEIYCARDTGKVVEITLAFPSL
jgi:hypothetical protein